MSARQWFPSGWVCSKSLQLLCVACLKLKIVVRLSQVVWGVTHPSLLCWGENVKHSGWEWFRDCRLPKAGLCQGPVEPVSQGIQSIQCLVGLPPCATPWPTLPSGTLHPEEGGSQGPLQMHISTVFIQWKIGTPGMSLFREAAARAIKIITLA